ncbi:MAG: hypothetical protein QW275_00285 [Candidatus Anstonellaceae archaeon]
MKKKQSEPSEKALGFDLQKYILYGLAAAVVVFFTVIFFAQAPNQAASSGSQAAELLLSAYEKGEQISTYQFEYSQGSEGEMSNYLLANDGEKSFVRVEGSFGAIEGYFFQGTPQVICLTYEEKKQCGEVGNHTGLNELASNLKAIFPSKSAYQQQRKLFENLIKFGAIRFEGEVVSDYVGTLSAKKISYFLNYRNLTVQQLALLGITPSSLEGLQKEQRVSFWIDDESGLIARTLADYEENGKIKSYETIYRKIDLSAPEDISIPNSTISPSRFYQFYVQSKEDFLAKERCRLAEEKEQPVCYRNLAYQKKDANVCRMISDLQEQEVCKLIIAQQTIDGNICGTMQIYADDCYINVAGQSGKAEICEKIANKSRFEECINASVIGHRKLEEQRLREEQAKLPQNCLVDEDCKVYGGSGQFCAPKNTTEVFGNETTEFGVCYAAIPCGCVEGYCKFKKDEEFYSCVDEIEERLMKEYLLELIEKKKTEGEGKE